MTLEIYIPRAESKVSVLAYLSMRQIAYKVLPYTRIVIFRRRCDGVKFREHFDL